MGIDDAGHRYRDIMRRHGLGPAAIARVEEALSRGRRLDDPAERRAAVDLGRLTQQRPGRARRWSGGSRYARATQVVVYLVFGAAVVLLLVSGELGALTALLPVVPIVALIEVWDHRRRHHLAEGIRLNEEERSDGPQP